MKGDTKVVTQQYFDECLSYRDVQELVYTRCPDGKIALRVKATLVDNTESYPTFNDYDEISGVIPTAESTIITKVTGAMDTAILHNVEVSSDSISTIRIKVDGTTIAKKRIGFGGAYNVDFRFDGFEVPENSTITVTGENCSSDNAEFEARINGRTGVA